MTTLITAADTRALMHLANEVGELHDQPEQCAQRLAAGVIDLLHAAAVGVGQIPAEYAMSSHRFAAPIEPYVPLAHFGPAGVDQIHHIVEMWREADARDLGFVHLAAHRDQSLAVLREEIVSDQDWYSSGYYQTTLKPSGIADKIYASTTPASGDTIVACVARMTDQPKFTHHETQLLAIIRDSLLPWFAETVLRHRRVTASHEADTESILRSLTANQTQVLSLLLDGLSESQVGARICRSKHTVHDHVKRLYQVLGVSSRVELGLRLADHRPLIKELLRQQPSLYRGVVPN